MKNLFIITPTGQGLKDRAVGSLMHGYCQHVGLEDIQIALRDGPSINVPEKLFKLITGEKNVLVFYYESKKNWGIIEGEALDEFKEELEKASNGETSGNIMFRLLPGWISSKLTVNLG